jgi:hypothetical protein
VFTDAFGVGHRFVAEEWATYFRYMRQFRFMGFRYRYLWGFCYSNGRSFCDARWGCEAGLAHSSEVVVSAHCLSGLLSGFGGQATLKVGCPVLHAHS